MKTKANIINRYLSGAVDFGLAVIIYSVLTSNLNIDFIVSGVFILFRDSFGKGKSIGKIIFNLNTRKLQDESQATYRESILRNFFFIIPIVNIIMIAVELFFISQDTDRYRIGDKIALTHVVDDDTKLNNEIKDTFIKTTETNGKE